MDLGRGHVMIDQVLAVLAMVAVIAGYLGSVGSGWDRGRAP